jgi:hypothetical protein
MTKTSIAEKGCTLMIALIFVVFVLLITGVIRYGKG